MAKIDADIRQAFGKMAPQAIISRAELAALLSTTEGAVSQMAYRDELPATAFPEKRRACWFVVDIRRWLDEKTANRPPPPATPQSEPSRTGRPRLPVDRNA
ncbi:hypothetical protein AAKU55_005626 [Oxalobacteraceae bacterium GrIS 1.11]